ncbi:hypothetical protein HKCCE4037_14860 [Rhodobacterales bacterium HKCCE4037]|nr:hypothetical protein [Rhodobacterales bacterium HKCCE4037]
MKTLGWVRAPLKGGDLFTLDLGDRFLVAFPQLMTLPDKRLVDTGGGVGLPELSRVAAAIGGRTFLYSALHDFPLDERRFSTATEPWPALLARATAQLTARAPAVDLTAALETAAAPERARFPTFTIHLAALVLLGRRDQLDAYAKALGAGPSDALHPLITSDTIRTATGLLPA